MKNYNRMPENFYGAEQQLLISMKEDGMRAEKGCLLQTFLREEASIRNAV